MGSIEDVPLVIGPVERKWSSAKASSRVEDGEEAHREILNS